METRCLLEQCLVHSSRGNSAAALECGVGALAVAETIRDEELIALGRLCVARAESSAGRHAKALQFAKEARAALLSLDEVEAMCIMADAYAATHRPTLAVSAALEARAKLDLMEPSVDDWDAKLYSKLMCCLNTVGQLEEMTKLARAAAERFCQKELPARQLQLLEGAAAIAQAGMRWSDGLEYLGEAVAVCKRLGDMRKLVKLLQLEAVLLHFGTRLDDAAVKLAEAESTASANNDDLGLAVTLRMSSYLCLYQGQFDKASSFAGRSQRVFHKLGDVGGEGTAALADALACLPVDEEAGRVAIREAQQLFQDAGDLCGEADLLLLISELDFDAERYDESLAAASGCRDLRKELKDKSG
eukprot:4893588-Amphidinium_carterae.1